MTPTLQEATRAIKALVDTPALVTFEAKFTINGDQETLEIRWFSTATGRGYSDAFPSLAAAMADARQAITRRTTVDVTVAE